MFVFLFSWFTGQQGPKSTVQKLKHCLTWDFLSALLMTFLFPLVHAYSGMSWITFSIFCLSVGQQLPPLLCRLSFHLWAHWEHKFWWPQGTSTTSGARSMQTTQVGPWCLLIEGVLMATSSATEYDTTASADPWLCCSTPVMLTTSTSWVSSVLSMVSSTMPGISGFLEDNVLFLKWVFA